MDKFQSLSANRLLFDLASRLGSLEGYLYAQENVDKSYLPNWLLNIEREFNCLSTVVKDEIQADYLELVKKIHVLLQRLYGEQDPNTAQVGGMVAALMRWEWNVRESLTFVLNNEKVFLRSSS